ncbi:MAG: hypothetical protein JNL60_07790 [Bacteroidia bacterium]|nr:hypothetical protein [Bacteroidia bacterium]
MAIFQAILLHKTHIFVKKVSFSPFLCVKKCSKRLVLLTLIVLVFNSCKKGEADPGFSFRTRKARLVGEWRLTSGSVSFNSEGYSRKYDFDGSNFTQYDTYTGGYPIVYTGKYILNLNIKKDGTFTLNEAAGSAALDASGTWSFNSGVGKRKSKESVIFDITTVNRGSLSTGHVFNCGSSSFSYRLKGLKNKELQMESYTLLQSDAGSDEVSQNAYFKFIQ